MAELQVRWHQSMADFSEAEWDRLLGDGEDVGPGSCDLPFFRWRWLHRLETSGSIVPRQGWQSCHLGLWRGTTLVAAAPLYLKGHSYGEFVFDQSFAQLAGQLGLRYYPKLVGMSPLSPVQGYRFLFAPGEDPAALTVLMLEHVGAFCRQNQILSCNFLYVDPAWGAIAQAAGWAPWINQQGLWTNPGHTTFDGYLASFNANQRRNIKRERKAVAAAGLEVSPLVGEAIPGAMVDRMHDFYAQHCSRWGQWGSKYLTHDFFLAASQELRSNLVLFSAHRGDSNEPVAMSLCVHNANQLWGRYWGSDEEIDSLHFEVCYYAPIAWAIGRGITSFDPGAGGAHKRRRGFVAEARTSLHCWFEPQFDAILRRWLPEANVQMGLEIEAVNAELPFTASYDPPHVPGSIFPESQRPPAAG